MPNSLGSTTKSIFVKDHEADKLNQEFVVASGQTITKGQMVALNATGEIVALTAGQTQEKFVGIALFSAVAGERTTVTTRGYTIVMMHAAGNISAGPVEAGTFTTGYNRVTTASAENKSIGWALNAATTAGDEVAVLVKD